MRFIGLLTIAVFALAGFRSCHQAAVDQGTPQVRAQEGATGQLEETRIDRAALLARVESLASDALGGRQVDSEGGRMARDSVVMWFTEVGLSPLANSGYIYPFTTAGRSGESVSGANVLGVIRGTEFPDRYIVLSAHYDHLGTRDGVVFNGADDNASGTSAIIAIAGYLANNRLRHSILVAAFDGEEGGLRGARAFVDNPPVPVSAILLNVNLDMVSRSEAGELYASGTYHNPGLRPVLEPLTRGRKAKLLFGHDKPEEGKDDWTRSSDHGPFHAAGIPFIYFGVEDHEGYHTPEDDFSDITPDFYVAATNVILDAVQRLDASITSNVP